MEEGNIICLSKMEEGNASTICYMQSLYRHKNVEFGLRKIFNYTDYGVDKSPCYPCSKLCIAMLLCIRDGVCIQVRIILLIYAIN